MKKDINGAIKGQSHKMGEKVSERDEISNKADLSREVRRFYDIVAQLRGEGGCPWDRAQTHQTLERYLLEEAWEVVDTIRTGQMNKLCEELGDLLLQIGLHARIAQEAGHFNLSDVASAINEKMVRRHPHVFGGAGASAATTPQEVVYNWDLIKKTEVQSSMANSEPGCESLSCEMRRVPANWPTTLQAERIQRIASRAGFDWENTIGVLDKVKEELGEVEDLLRCDTESPTENRRLEEEIGDLLFSVVNLARFGGMDPEKALGLATRRFVGRFERMEQMAHDNDLRLSEMTIDEKDQMWESVKKEQG